MRTIIAGSRDFTCYEEVLGIVADSGFKITQVVSGDARGVDKIGVQIAQDYSIPFVRFPADWDRYGKKAGAIRNREMAENADALVAIWNGFSPGTKNMIDIANRLGLLVHIGIVECT